MRIALLPALLIAASCTIPKGTGDALGVWRVNQDGSTGPHLDIVAVRFERHTKGAIFTLDRVDRDGRTTIEILRKCANGELIRFVRQSTGQPKELALAITDQKQDGHYGSVIWS
jgi:hypothetical protein